MKKLFVLVMLLILATSSQASEFCTGIGLFARAGAMYRDQGTTEEQAIAAVDQGSSKYDADTKVVVRYFLRFGYRGNQTPDQAFASAEQKCRQYEIESAENNAMK
ncbi:hypothetical protein ACOXVJ_13630 [Pseudomonas knackmussii]|uniref:hypothetical protein n=1 Tax=Pseudomonas knackmussii TaxID=65741 RepID=UPI003BE52518